MRESARRTLLLARDAQFRDDNEGLHDSPHSLHPRLLHAASKSRGSSLKERVPTLVKKPWPPLPGVSKRVCAGLPAPGSKTCPKQSRKSLRSLKTVCLRLRRLFRDCFGHVSDPGAGRPQETLLETPGRGGRDPNSCQETLVVSNHLCSLQLCVYANSNK